MNRRTFLETVLKTAGLIGISSASSTIGYFVGSHKTTKQTREIKSKDNLKEVTKKSYYDESNPIISNFKKTATDNSKPNGLNLILIITDTWRTDYLGFNENPHIKTPNLDRFAEESIVFTNAYADGLPTVPARKVYYTGKSVLPKAELTPLDKDAITLSEVLTKHGIKTGLITDVPHYFKPGYNTFNKGFLSWNWIRGQGYLDNWKLVPDGKYDTKKYIPPHLWNNLYSEWISQYLANTEDRRNEEDYFCAECCNFALNWLERNRKNSPFFLTIDMFDPHEPWDAPPRFKEMYRKDFGGIERYLFEYGINPKKVKSEDIPILKDLYSAEVTFSDYCIGRLLKGIDELGLRNDTIVVFTSDHGTHLGEEGYVQKSPELTNKYVMQLPLMIRHPSYSPRKIDGLVSAIDYAPTFLRLVGINSSLMQGNNMWDLVNNRIQSLHEEVYTSFAGVGSVRNHSWHYFQSLGFGIGLGRKPDTIVEPHLFDLKNDQQEMKNVIKEYPDVGREMKEKLKKRMVGLVLP